MNEDYGKIIEYNSFLDDFKRESNIKTGYFYTYKYKFRKNYPHEELKYYDWRPLSFVFKIVKPKFEMNSDKKIYFQGLNFHHLPVKARQWWLSRLKFIASNKFEKGGVRRIPGLNADTLPMIMRKSPLGFRNYRFEAVTDLRIIKLEDLDEVLKFYANTYYGVTIKQIQTKYNSFRI